MTRRRDYDAEIDLVLGLKVALQALTMANVVIDQCLTVQNLDEAGKSFLRKIRKRHVKAAAILAKHTGRPADDCL